MDFKFLLHTSVLGVPKFCILLLIVLSGAKPKYLLRKSKALVALVKISEIFLALIHDLLVIPRYVADRLFSKICCGSV